METEQKGKQLPASTKTQERWRQLADIILLDPHMTNMELAAQTGYAPATISIITSSDAFRAMLAQMRKDAVPFVVSPLQARARAVAAIALERLGTKVQTVNDPEVLLKIADTMMDQAEPKAVGPTQQNNVFMVAAGTLKEMREQMVKGALPPQGAEAAVPSGVIEGEVLRIEEGRDESPTSADEVPST